MKPSIHPLALRVRLLRPDGNPLRRRSDRVESVLVLAAVLLVLACVWPAVLAGRAAYSDAAKEQHAGPGLRTQVMATLTENAPPSRVSYTEVPAVPLQATARWTTPQGATVTGLVPVPALATSGTQVPVWVDASGMPVQPPADDVELVSRGVATALFVVFLAGVVALAAFAACRRLLDRRRYQEWEADWLRADERWRRPHHP
ncbi:membrane protein SCJ126 [[Actinomadura] parvosata subsp. kistnae]|uniref:Rv1733c family protein n=1 Tax=[Actinomadura] parvosata TaxID=1955412 RepID=UPI000D2E3121|nr:hypothetical protein [Nonomuraea sp. ATCC 55076]SPL97907.1 membrane protein SCJ126 [Actinomadura parvosata subsp. kistnae]